MSIYVFIKEDSCIARIAAWKLNAKSVAIVIGNTIHLWNTNKSSFLKQTSWVKHEVAHVMQWYRLGFIFFPCAYLFLSIIHGYSKHPHELEAKIAENDMNILEKVIIP
ncbi:MAG: DUF4157 domain-containing protein [Chitinophagaceae bacterium]